MILLAGPGACMLVTEASRPTDATPADDGALPDDGPQGDDRPIADAVSDRLPLVDVGDERFDGRADDGSDTGGPDAGRDAGAPEVGSDATPDGLDGGDAARPDVVGRFDGPFPDGPCTSGIGCSLRCDTPYVYTASGASVVVDECQVSASGLTCGGVFRPGHTVYTLFDVPDGGCHVTWPGGYRIALLTGPCGGTATCCDGLGCAGMHALTPGRYWYALQRDDGTCGINLVEFFCP